MTSRWPTLCRPCLWENVPESEGLIPSSRHDGTSIRVHCQVEHPKGVTSQRRNLFHRGVLPNYNLVQRVTMSAYQLIICLRKDKIANLRASVYAAQLRKIDSVPESDALISRATTGCQEASVEGAPIDGFHSGLMV